MQKDTPLKKNPLSFQIDPNLFEPASEEEKAQQVTQRESVSFMRDAMRRLRKNKIAMICLAIIVLIALIAFIAAAPMLFFPRFMWMLDTLKYRMFYNWDTTPSHFALVGRKVVTYVVFVIGTGSILYGYWLYL